MRRTKRNGEKRAKGTKQKRPKEREKGPMNIWTLAVVGSVPGWSLLCGSWMMACWCAASMVFFIFSLRLVETPYAIRID